MKIVQNIMMMEETESKDDQGPKDVVNFTLMGRSSSNKSQLTKIEMPAESEIVTNFKSREQVSYLRNYKFD